MFMINPTPLPKDVEDETVISQNNEVTQSNMTSIEDEWDNINGDLILFV